MTAEEWETERKYEAPPGMALPPLDEFPQVARVSVPEAETLTAQYFDTEDFRLLKSGVTLRRREGGADEGWHLKLPAPEQPNTRRELRLPLARPADPVPAEFASLVMALTRQAPMRPVARIETRRHRTTLLDGDGTSLAEVVADEVAAQSLGARTVLSQWDEIEVEQTGDNGKLLRAVDKRLRAAGLRPADRSTKLERALAVELPASRAGQRLTPGSTAGDVVLGYLASQAARLVSLDLAIRRDEPDAVHQMRVTARRLRSALQAFRDIVPGDATRHTRDGLKQLGRVLADAREGEVLSAYLRDSLADTPAELVMGPAQARIRAHFAPRQAAARGDMLRMLNSPAYFELLDELDRLLADPPLTPLAGRPAGKVLPGAVARSYRRTRRRMRHALRAPAGPARDAALHAVRKAAKQTRYAAEAARPAAGKPARRFAKRLKAIQSALGDHQDTVDARAAVREIGVHAQLAGESAFSFGLLHERARRDALEHQARARRAWRRATRPKVLRWLTR